MNSKSKETTANAAPEFDRYFPGDPIPVPLAAEANTESAWAHFSDFVQYDEPDFADTVPACELEPSSLPTPREGPGSN